MMNKEGLKKVINKCIKVLSYISLIILFLVALFLIFYITTNQYARVKKQPPILSLYTIVSPSMEPTIKVYDVIVETRVKDENDLKVGDIITFYSNEIDTGGYTVTHRIKDIREVNGKKQYITKGDNNHAEDDGYILFSNIVGRVHFVIPALGKIQFFISSRIGWLFIILIPAFGIIIMDIVKIRKLFQIKMQIESIPQLSEVEEIREKEENKKLRALIEKANRINKE